MPGAVPCLEPFDTALKQQTARARGVFVPYIALEEMRQSGDARVGMQSETRQRFGVRVDQVEKGEGLKDLTKIALTHQRSDKAVATSMSAVDDIALVVPDRARRIRLVGFGHVEASLPALG